MRVFSDKLWKANELIRNYNTKIEELTLPEGVKRPQPVDEELFVKKLMAIGGVADEFLRQCSWEELENCGLPRLLAREIAHVFRQKKIHKKRENPSERWKHLVGTIWGIERWKDFADATEWLEREALKEGFDLINHTVKSLHDADADFRRFLERARIRFL